MLGSKPPWVTRHRRILLVLSGIFALIAVSVVLASAVQKVRITAHRLNSI